MEKVNTYMREADIVAAKAAAKREGMTLAGFIRWAVMKAIKAGEA